MGTIKRQIRAAYGCMAAGQSQSWFSCFRHKDSMLNYMYYSVIRFSNGQSHTTLISGDPEILKPRGIVTFFLWFHVKILFD